MNIESSHKFNRSGDTAYGCIKGVNLEQSQVGVFEVTIVHVMQTTTLQGMKIINCTSNPSGTINNNINIIAESRSFCIGCIFAGVCVRKY